jgi:LmbE family N-acetylglucosaminyl deacetylase
MKRVVIFGAHLDDIEFGMGGTLAKLSSTYEIIACIFCKGNRPGAETVQVSRETAFQQNINDLGITHTIQLGYSDVSLDCVSSLELSRQASGIITKFNPDIVFTHYSSDIHCDHQMVSKAARIACRPREGCSVQEFYEYSIPGSTEWSHTSPNFNTFFDISEYTDLKYECISRYSTELKGGIDPLNLEYIKHRDCYYGGLYGVCAAEPFLNIYSRK